MHSAAPGKPNVLIVNSSARNEGSVSRELVQELVANLEASRGPLSVTHRDLAKGIDFVSQAWIAANFTDDADRDENQRRELANSDLLVQEVMDAQILILGVPVYNFGIPAALKAWIDMVARARKTFRYTSNGPEGLLTGKKAYLVVATGGVPVDSPVDFATPYLRHALKFIGITDVEVISAEQINSRGVAATEGAREQISNLMGRESPRRVTALAG
jgi:FMN-dependent NADH-azoreductase